jgi:hypothetical protein
LHASEEPVALLLTYVVLKKASMSAPQQLSGCVLGGWAAEQGFVLAAKNSRSSTIAGMVLSEGKCSQKCPCGSNIRSLHLGRKSSRSLQEIDSWARKHLL